MSLIEELQEEGLQFERRRVPIFRKDRHLSSALLTSEIQYMLQNKDNPRGLKKEHRALLARISDPTTVVRPSVDFISWSAREWQNFAQRGQPITPLTASLRVASEALRVSLKDYAHVSYTLKTTPTDKLVILYNIKKTFDTVIKNITYQTAFYQEYTLGVYKGDTYGNLHLIWENKTTCWLVTHSHLVAIRDMFNAWFSVYLYSQIYQKKYPGFDFDKEVDAVIQAARQALVLYSRRAYTLFKLWPSLTIACILRDTEGKSELYNELMKDLHPYELSTFVKLVTRPVCSDTQAQMQLELSELCKCFGHPDIDMNASVRTWIRKVAAGKDPCTGVADLITWTFRLEFCRQYYKRHKRWPTVIVGTEAPYKIRRNYLNNLWEEKPMAPWHLEDFQHIILDKNLDFDYHIDISDLLSDKSIIPERSQWIYEYDRQAHRTNHGFFPTRPASTSKSVVIHYLQKERITVKEVIDVLQTGIIPLSWRAMVAVAKEREFKFEDARFYGKMCFEMRLYQTAAEKNIADHIFRYIKHQSMTMSEEQLTRTILRMNTPIIHLEGETYVFIVLDFSSWCANFRYELITPLFIELDRLFGLHNVYSFTHYLPLISVLLFQDRFEPPKQGPSGDPLNGPRCYHGPEAWLEGLRQKGWTLPY